ncbi:Cell division cycle 7-related protein kinase [Acropora cervicornis]|uniref:non-specific serine/threonine protein kinase n=1 Tax=Acropora cervicornis TaxID=6130 RepID=A0AAD9V9C1_ACRCE|nr:Cell division cycle 7-related protein kinase [Acropora cervicornis]
MEECRTEASIGIEYSDSIDGSSQDENTNSTSVKTNGQVDGCAPSQRRKRKRISPHSTPKVAEGFGDSEAGELLKKIPEIQDIFTTVSKIGEGTFSNVYLVRMNEIEDELWALKHIIPTSGPGRVENELKCLQDIGGTDNVIGIQFTLRCNDNLVFVLPYFPHQKFQEYFLEMSVCEIKEYMKNLLIALKRVHSFDVIHRDVKPSNFLYSRDTERFRLVDFGLAMKVPGSTCSLLDSPKEAKKKRRMSNQSPKRSLQPRRRSSRLSPPADHPASKVAEDSILKPRCVNTSNWEFTHQSKDFKVPSKNATSKLRRSSSEKSSGKVSFQPAQVLCPLRHGPKEVCTICMARGHQNTPRAGTPGFRSPEVLLKYPQQSPAVDMWSAGVIFLCILSGRYPFFKAYDDMMSLAQIMTLCGTDEAAKTAFKLGKDVNFSSDCPAGNLKILCTKLRSRASKNPTVKCCVKQSNSSKKLRKKSSSSSSSQPQVTMDSQPWHQRCLICQKRNPHRCISVEEGRTRDRSEEIHENTNGSRENSELARHIHLDGSECGCACCICCWVIEDAAYDLLRRLLDLNPHTRITASQALEHAFFKDNA